MEGKGKNRVPIDRLVDLVEILAIAIFFLLAHPSICGLPRGVITCLNFFATVGVHLTEEAQPNGIASLTGAVGCLWLRD